jgi:TRAP-type C4-dicarboxylate transport system permease small subunit
MLYLARFILSPILYCAIFALFLGAVVWSGWQWVKDR